MTFVNNTMKLLNTKRTQAVYRIIYKSIRKSMDFIINNP